ncbi:MAG: DUF2238 domain-containing protein [candidate division NC10 bacterium]|nr:DUF2238 domain-containing protein [candidate division NC10 bacterium]
MFHDFLLENVLTLVAAVLVIGTYRRFRLSNISYTLIFVYMCLHTVGAHYTYALVPYDQWFRSLFGISLTELFGFRRNHYDRLVHFSFGLLIAYPIREVFLRIANVRGAWGYYLPLDVTMSFSMLYELIEWAVAVVFGGDLGTAYLGTQGDEWDAHKDMALATFGAVLSMSTTAFINWKYSKRFGEEWWESLAVKGRRPLGEVKLWEMLDELKGAPPAERDEEKRERPTPGEPEEDGS